MNFVIVVFVVFLLSRKRMPFDEIAKFVVYCCLVLVFVVILRYDEREE